MPVIVGSGGIDVFTASAIGRICVIEPNERLGIRRPKNNRVTYAMGTLGRYIGSRNPPMGPVGVFGSLSTGGPAVVGRDVGSGHPAQAMPNAQTWSVRNSNDG